MAAMQPDSLAMMKERAAQHAATLVQDGMVIGLGTGSTAFVLLEALAARALTGLRFTGIPTSEATAAHARQLGIPLASLDDGARPDMTIDGADEVDPQLDLIKGFGGALLREKIVAAAAAQLVIIVDQSKMVEQLGSRNTVPVEVVTFGWVPTGDGLRALGGTVERRMVGDRPFLTDSGNYLLDCHFGPIDRPATLGAQIKALTGVVDHGLFLGMASTVIVGHPDRIETRTR